MKQYLSLYTSAGGSGPTPEHMAEMNKLVEEMTRNGSLVVTGAMVGANLTVKLANGDFTVKDAPPMKETGFAILRAGSRDQIVEMSKRFLEVAGDGTCQVHELMGGAPPK